MWWHPGFPGSDLDYEPYGETVEFDGPSELIEPGGLSDDEWPDDAGQLESDRQGLDPDAESTGVEKQRQLLAQLLHGREVCQTSLSPGTEYDLSVRIAIPRDGERGIVFPESEVRDDPRGVADLVVDVASADGSYHQTAPIKLPTSDRTRPSTTAGFKLTAGEEDSFLELRITVLYQKRAIQAGVLLATVRSLALQTDEVQFFAVPLSAPREPLPTITPADVNLDDNGLRLATVGQEPRYEIPLTGNDQWAETFEREASTVLGTDYAPSALDDRRAVRLLIALARAGRRFADRLETSASATRTQLRCQFRSIRLCSRWNWPTTVWHLKKKRRYATVIDGRLHFRRSATRHQPLSSARMRFGE